jgi:hypothetical protein
MKGAVLVRSQLREAARIAKTTPGVGRKKATRVLSGLQTGLRAE